MSKHEEAQIGDMTLEQMMARSRVEARTYNDLPLAGGECDTLSGWCRRLGFRKHDRLTASLLPWLEERGLAERVDGYMLRAGNPYSCRLVRSAELKRMADKRSEG